MATRKNVLLRIDSELHRAYARWADDELRSLNAQLEHVLRRAAESAGRIKRPERRSRS